MDALNDIKLETLMAGAAAEQGINLSEWDMKNTVKAAVWTGSARRRAWNMELAWDRAGLRANRFHSKAANRKKREEALRHLAGDKEAWYRACSDQEVEDSRHLMTRYGCYYYYGWEAYRAIRRRWHEKVKKEVRVLSPVLDGSFAVALSQIMTGCYRKGQERVD